MTRYKLKLIAMVFVLALSCTLALARDRDGEADKGRGRDRAPAAEQAKSKKATVAMNFKDAEIEAVVKFISELTGKNFIMDDKVRGKVTVISPTRLSRDEAYEVFQAILGVKGFTIVPTGKVLKILPQADAMKSNIEMAGPDAPPGDRHVTQLVPLKNVDAEVVTRILDPLRSKNSSIVAYEPSNTLIITDAFSNIERLLRIIDAIDIETLGMELKIFQLNHASAEVLGKIIEQTVSATPARKQQARRAPQQGQAAVQVGGETPTKIISDERTNSIIVIADPRTMEDVEELLAALDVDIPSGTGKINVYRLKYADAESVASVLNAITKEAGTKAQPGRPQVKATKTKAETVPVEFEEPVSITADKATNSLVIVAMPQDFRTLSEVVKKLDVRRPQVLVEALILEMKYERTLDMGVEWRTADPYDTGTNVVGGTNFGGLTGAGSGLFSAQGLFMAAIDGVVEVGDQEFLNVGALVSALQTKGDVEVISTPHLLTTDNEEAEIIVSDNIPFPTDTRYDTNGTPIFSYDYRDVGLTLRFTPQINDDDFVRLNLFQEISDVVSLGSAVNPTPTTTKRSAKTTVVVRDGSTVAIGGLIKDKKNFTESSVPCLGDIPILGFLFRKQGDSNGKTNLMIFLTPRIIRETRHVDEITEEKLDQYEKLLQEKRRRDDPTMKWEEPSEGEAEVQDAGEAR